MVFANFYGVIDGGFLDLLIGIILNLSIYHASKQSVASGDKVALFFVQVSILLILFKISLDFYVVSKLTKLQR